ncbi:MAG: lytic transglycosylase domain-containing protein [Pseudomonadota bacterium]|nr:MAG: lytic transglycosylase domain-containing protein [Pseudomonadota bacterium]
MNRQAVCKILLILALACPPAVMQAAAVYEYALPDGRRLITDQARYDTTYTLIRVIRDFGDFDDNSRKLTTKLQKFEALIRAASLRHQVESALIKAVIHAESHFDPAAVSHSGASGLMQLMPQTAARYGVHDLHDPAQNIEAGTRHLRYLLDRFGAQLHHVLAAYNAGEKAVDTHNGVPPYGETRRYIEKVLDYRAWYRSRQSPIEQEM